MPSAPTPLWDPPCISRWPGRIPRGATVWPKPRWNMPRQRLRKAERRPISPGSLGPCPGAIEADSGDTSFGIANHLVREAHQRLAEALAEGGVDFFCIETMFSAREAAIAVDVARRYGLPVAVNLTYKYTQDRDSGRVTYKTDWGHSALDLLEIPFSRASFPEGTTCWTMWPFSGSTAAPNPDGRSIRACPMPYRG